MRVNFVYFSSFKTPLMAGGLLDNQGCLYYNNSNCKVDFHISFYGKITFLKGCVTFMTAFKKPLCGLLAFIMVFVFVAATPVSVFADDEEEEVTLSAQEIELNKKTDEDGFEYIKIEDNSSIQIVGYTGNEKEVSVPSRINSLSVISIGVGAFEGNSTMESIDLHSDIVEICEGAFKDCTALKEIKDADAVAEIGAGAFEGCTSLAEFTIPDTVTLIPERCFAGCTALTEIEVHKNLKNVAKDALVGSGYENEQKEGALALGRVLYSFKGNPKTVEIPEEISLIEAGAFLGCESLEALTLGYDIQEIGEFAFQNCVNLKKVDVNEALGVIEAGAFKGCSSLKAMDFSEATVATIGYEAFSGCTSLGEVKLCETLSDIGDYAFAYTKIKTIEFMKNVSAVGFNTFHKADALESINVVDKNKNYNSVDGILFNEDGNVLVKFPAAKKGTYELPQEVEEICESAFRGSKLSKVELADEPALNNIGAYAFAESDIISFQIPENVTKINTATFKNAKKLSKIVFAEGVKYIGAYAFAECSSLSKAILPESLSEVAVAAFKNAGIKELVTGDGLTKICEYAFAGCKNLSSVALGNNAEKISDNAFKNCKALKSFAFGKATKEFSARAFAGCSSLAKLTVSADNKNIKAVNNAVYSKDGATLIMVANMGSHSIAKGTKTIADGAYEIAAKISSIAFPATLREIKNSALDGTAWYKKQGGVVYAGPVLYKVKNASSVAVKAGTKAIADNAINSYSVKKVSLPASLVRIGDNAFAGSGIKSVSIPDNVSYIGVCAFENCKVLSSVKLSKSVKAINSATFKGCSALAKIALPASVKAIGPDTFADCKKLAVVDFGVVEEIQQYAFSGCASLKVANLPSTLKDVEPKAFVGCKALETINAEEGATYKSVDGVLLVANETEEENAAPVFETIALYPAGKTGEYTVPAEVKHIADRAFYDCDGLTAIKFHDAYENTGAEAFFDCDGIQKIEMPESARGIGDHAFASCDNLREFVVYSNLTDYAENAFEGCYYFNYDAVTINVEDNSAMILVFIGVAFVAIGLVWYLRYQKKQKKIQQEIIEKNKKKEQLEALEKAE